MTETVRKVKGWNLLYSAALRKIKFRDMHTSLNRNEFQRSEFQSFRKSHPEEYD